jgi:antitoxin (DNA-binding transcriptional repressor) of toxin-antitoxin stability system
MGWYLTIDMFRRIPCQMDTSKMKKFNLGAAKREWDQLVASIQSGQESGFVICKRGEPAALLLPIETSKKS